MSNLVRIATDVVSNLQKLVDLDDRSLSIVCNPYEGQPVTITRGSPSAHQRLDIMALCTSLTLALQTVPLLERLPTKLAIHLDGPGCCEVYLELEDQAWSGKLLELPKFMAVLESGLTTIASIAPDTHEPALYVVVHSSVSGPRQVERIAGSPRQAMLFHALTRSPYADLAKEARRVLNVYRVCDAADWQLSVA